ncbi:MAG: alpha/beta fold hydrolase, partial [Alphaproteobacteria bacterium]|nr:alpha/beta fold hydrolase [Alphaproteobacteria bacterium]
MNDQPGVPDPAELAKTVAGIAERSQRLLLSYMEKQGAEPGSLDPLNLGQAFFDLTARLMADPAKLIQAQMTLWNDYMSLWQSAARRMMGESPAPVAEAPQSDRRFKDAEWRDNPFFDYLKQSYLLTSRWLLDTVQQVDGLDDKTAKKINFYTRQFVDALSPSNFAVTNPEVLRATVESRGENLVKGLDNLLKDLERGKGRLAIRMTDLDAFEVGKNVAVTSGKVVYRNDLIELIQYAPRTETVWKRPLLVIPPWINKYYILDLRPDNSFVRWAADQGHTVFIVSWVNPDEALAAKSFEDYMFEGVLDALDAVGKATGEPDANVVGYCLGGTLLACALAYMTAKGDNRIKSATFLTALTDFREPGDLGVFIDEEQLRSLEADMNKKGYLEGAHMATTFNMLRANDLIWSFVVNNYLLGKEPFPFDLLYWNSDSTRMPAAMHSFYLRKMYQENKLAQPSDIALGGVPIDLRAIK